MRWEKSASGEDSQIVLLCVNPDLRVGKSRTQIQGVRDRQTSLKQRNSRKVLVQQKTRHIADSNE